MLGKSRIQFGEPRNIVFALLRKIIASLKFVILTFGSDWLGFRIHE